jgi:putative permease
MTQNGPALNRFIIAVLAVAVLVVAVYALQNTISCFFLSFVFAYLLDPFVVFLERKKLRRIYGILILYLLLTAIMAFALIYLLPMLTMHWESMLRDLPRYLQKLKEIATGWQGRFEPRYGSTEWQWLYEKLSANLDKVFGKIGSGVYLALSSMVFNLFTLLLAPILVFFMLFYKKDILRGIKSWLPERFRAAILEMGREINHSIGGYLWGQLIVSVIVAILAAAAMFALDIDYPLLNGIFAGAASVLPFIGVIIATIPPLFFAYLKFQSLLMLFKVFAAFSVIYFIEGYVIKPLVFKKAMEINPLLTIVVVMAFGELLGFWGILLAVPIAAAIKIAVAHLRRGDFAGGSEQ